MTSLSQPDLLFHAVCNAQYHTARRRTLERWSRWLSALTIILGTAVVAEAAGSFGMRVDWLGLATAIAGTFQLVFDFAGRARTHELLQRRYYDLIAAIRRKPMANETEIADWNGVITLIYGDEPPVEPVGNALAYNAASNTLGAEAGELLVVPWWLLILGFFGLVWSWRFETVDERAARRAAHKARKAPAVAAPPV